MVSDYAVDYSLACRLRCRAEETKDPDVWKMAGDAFAKLGMVAASEQCYRKQSYYAELKDYVKNTKPGYFS